MRDRSILMLMLAILLLAGASQAQERGHVPGGFGWTFAEETDTYYGAQFGVGLSNNLQIVGGFEKMNDVLTGRYALLLFGDNFMAEATFDFFDVLAEREDFSTVSALRPAFASSQSSF